MGGKNTHEKAGSKGRPAQKSSDESIEVVKSLPAPARRRLTKVELSKSNKDFYIIGIGARRILQKGTQTQMILLAMEDITGK